MVVPTCGALVVFDPAGLGGFALSFDEHATVIMVSAAKTRGSVLRSIMPPKAGQADPDPSVHGQKDLAGGPRGVGEAVVSRPRTFPKDRRAMSGDRRIHAWPPAGARL